MELPLRLLRLQMPQKVAKSMTKTTIQSPDGFQPGATFQVAPKLFKDHPSTRGRLTGPRNKLQENQTGHQYIHELLVD